MAFHRRIIQSLLLTHLILAWSNNCERSSSSCIGSNEQYNDVPISSWEGSRIWPTSKAASLNLAVDQLIMPLVIYDLLLTLQALDYSCIDSIPWFETDSPPLQRGKASPELQNAVEQPERSRAASRLCGTYWCIDVVRQSSSLHEWGQWHADCSTCCCIGFDCCREVSRVR